MYRFIKSERSSRAIWQRVLAASMVFACAAGSVVAGNAAEIAPQLKIRAADITPSALSTGMLGAARAGKRIVSVGDHGAILLSDDDGRSFRQAGRVPVSSALTSVYFVDDKTGWATGHWGVILHTVDGGQTWTLQRSDLASDQPLFSVYFSDPREGWAIGLWSLMLHTMDGGVTWEKIALPPGPGSKKADRNLYGIFADKQGGLYVAAERGALLVSRDKGATWTYVETGYQGSFWCGAALPSGTLLVGGLRGTLYRSIDGGSTWTRAHSEYRSSITAIVPRRDGTVSAVALDGVELVSHDDGATFAGAQRPDRLPLTAAVENADGTLVRFSTTGPATK